MTTETLRVREPRDMLAMVPFQLGFVPSESLVAISLRGPRRRVGVVGRVDLPPTEHAAELAVRLTAHLAADGAREALVVVYSAHEDPLEAVELAVVLDAMHDALEDAGIRLLDAWHVGAKRYRSLVCVDPCCVDPCCPAEGFPVESLLSSVVAAEMTVRGAGFAGTRQEVLADLTPAPDERLAQVERHVVRSTAPSAARDRGRPRARWAERALRTWRSEVERVTPSRATTGAGSPQVEVGVEAAGRLLAGLEDLAVRDAVMLACVPGSGQEPERLARAGRANPSTHALFDRVFGTAGALRPDTVALVAASGVLSSLVRQASGRRAAPPLSLLAWLAWWAGDGGIARDYVNRALEADPAHRFADLVAQSLDRGVAPGWVERDRWADAAAVDRTTVRPSAC
jgi:Domain of unknown function (DUF4192)